MTPHLLVTPVMLTSNICAVFVVTVPQVTGELTPDTCEVWCQMFCLGSMEQPQCVTPAEYSSEELSQPNKNCHAHALEVVLLIN